MKLFYEIILCLFRLQHHVKAGNYGAVKKGDTVEKQVEDTAESSRASEIMDIDLVDDGSDIVVLPPIASEDLIASNETKNLVFYCFAKHCIEEWHAPCTACPKVEQYDGTIDYPLYCKAHLGENEDGSEHAKLHACLDHAKSKNIDRLLLDKPDFTNITLPTTKKTILSSVASKVTSDDDKTIEDQARIKYLVDAQKGAKKACGQKYLLSAALQASSKPELNDISSEVRSSMSSIDNLTSDDIKFNSNLLDSWKLVEDKCSYIPPKPFEWNPQRDASVTNKVFFANDQRQRTYQVHQPSSKDYFIQVQYSLEVNRYKSIPPQYIYNWWNTDAVFQTSLNHESKCLLAQCALKTPYFPSDSLVAVRLLQSTCNHPILGMILCNLNYLKNNDVQNAFVELKVRIKSFFVCFCA